VATGGGAMLRPQCGLLTIEAGIRVQLADEPLSCVVRGCCKASVVLDGGQRLLSAD
jgi:actin-like ATPase involved in cell morphogenesis